MLSNYFQLKTKTQEFKDQLTSVIEEIKDKKVILYGAGEGFLELNKKYNFKNNLNIVAIADKKFECPCECTKDCQGIRAIAPKQIVNEDYDVILITNEYSKPIVKYLCCDLNIENKEIKTVFNEEIADERINLNYLSKLKFEKNLPKLIKKLKNKKVVFYGAGVYLELIKKYYDISKLNVIGIADRKFENYADTETFLDYKTYSPNEIIDLKPDYVIVTTKNFINIIEDLYYDLLKGTKIKIKPLAKKSFLTLVKEIWFS